MSPHEVLKQALTDAVAALAIPLFWEGTTYTRPLTPHLVARIVTERTEAASLGSHGLTRTDGALVAECSTVSGQGDGQAVELARSVSRLFPRGHLFEVDGGELTIATPVSGSATPDGRRITVPLKIPFYALTQEG